MVLQDLTISRFVVPQAQYFAVTHDVSLYGSRTLRTHIEERLTALVDSQHHGREASKLCRTAADREFTKQVMDDLEKQIRSLRVRLKGLGS